MTLRRLSRSERVRAERPPHRTIVVGALHDTLRQRRREQQTPEFKRRMQQRNGLEGSMSEMVRGHGLRRARYRGWAKVDLQNQLAAAACNVKRWLKKLVKAAFRASPSPLPSLKGLRALCSIQPGFLSWSLAELTPFHAFTRTVL